MELSKAGTDMICVSGWYEDALVAHWSLHSRDIRQMRVIHCSLSQLVCVIEAKVLDTGILSGHFDLEFTVSYS